MYYKYSTNLLWFSLKIKYPKNNIKIIIIVLNIVIVNVGSWLFNIISLEEVIILDKGFNIYNPIYLTGTMLGGYAMGLIQKPIWSKTSHK